MNPCNHIEVFITAGGKSTRMGQEKGTMLLDGKPMIQHLTDMLRENGFPLTTIIANRRGYEHFGCKVAQDIVPDKGPMGALHTAFHYAEKSHVLLLSCDMPFLPAAAVGRLVHAMKNEQVTAAQIMTKINPLCAFYHCSLKQKVATCIQENKLKMQAMIVQTLYRTVTMDDLAEKFPWCFINFNEPKDLAQWKQQLQPA